MPDILIAILIALNSLFVQNAAANAATPYSEQEILKKANYIFENNLYKVNDGGVIMDPDVSL
ncbi:MAG: hypothetical protein ABIT08_05540 [Bacteroidia bacterium]